MVLLIAIFRLFRVKTLADALSKAIGADKVTYTLIDGAGHGGSQFSTDANLKVVVDFLNKYLQ